MSNAYKYYKLVTGKSIVDYAIDFQRAWTIYASNVLKRFYDDTSLATYERYDNLYEVENGSVRSDLIDYINSMGCVPLDPNEFPCFRSSTQNMSSWFDLYDKNRKLTNQIMSDNGHYV